VVSAANSVGKAISGIKGAVKCHVLKTCCESENMIFGFLFRYFCVFRDKVGCRDEGDFPSNTSVQIINAP
jgi:hypothetical protein